MIDPSDDPLEQAEEAIARANEQGIQLPGLPVLVAALAFEVRGLRKDMKAMAKRFAFQRFIIGGLVLTLVALALVVVDNRQTSSEACRRDNELRRANTELWAPILASSPTPTLPPDPTPEDIEDFDRRIDQRVVFERALTEGFALHDC
jgi:hypothetical protein